MGLYKIESKRISFFFTGTVFRFGAVSWFSDLEFATLNFIKPSSKISFHFQNFSRNIIKEEVELWLSIWIWFEIIFLEFDKAWLIIDLLQQRSHLIFQAFIIRLGARFLGTFTRSRGTLILFSTGIGVFSLPHLLWSWLTFSCVNLSCQLSKFLLIASIDVITLLSLHKLDQEIRNGFLNCLRQTFVIFFLWTFEGRREFVKVCLS